MYYRIYIHDTIKHVASAYTHLLLNSEFAPVCSHAKTAAHAHDKDEQSLVLSDNFERTVGCRGVDRLKRTEFCVHRQD